MNESERSEYLRNPQEAMRPMTPEQRIDAALDSVLKASGSALRHYTMPKSLADMREAMRKVISDAYIKGSNDAIESTVNPRGN